MAQLIPALKGAGLEQSQTNILGGQSGTIEGQLLDLTPSHCAQLIPPLCSRILQGLLCRHSDSRIAFALTTLVQVVTAIGMVDDLELERAAKSSRSETGQVFSCPPKLGLVQLVAMPVPIPAESVQVQSIVLSSERI